MNHSKPQNIAFGQESTSIEYHPSMGMNFIFTTSTYIEEHKMFGPVERMEVKCTAKSEMINITSRLQYLKSTEVICIFPNNLGFLKYVVN